MGHKARTKDENFMIKIYEEATSCGDMDKPFDRYEIGLLAGIQPKGVNAICTLLLQANFVKKRGDSDVSITPHGIKLVERILSDS
ncbi:MAG: hypothetical protein Q8K60_06155 [Parachlamydiaceae bacterium]|nr:hypothetical protein [Parachlamydiaceae bacterium]